MQGRKRLARDGAHKFLAAWPVSSWKLCSRCSNPRGGLTEASPTRVKGASCEAGDLAESGVVKAVSVLSRWLLAGVDSSLPVALIESDWLGAKEEEGFGGVEVDQAWSGGEAGRDGGGELRAFQGQLWIQGGAG